MFNKSKQTQFHNRITSEQVWYRLFRYTHGEYYGEHQIGLGRGYFIDLYVGTIPGFVWSFEKLQNRSPEIERHLERLRFYLQWFDPVIRLPLLLLLPRLLARLRGLGKRGLPTIQNTPRAHFQPLIKNQAVDAHSQTNAKLLGDSHSICRA